jgi:hypothetical protein
MQQQHRELSAPRRLRPPLTPSRLAYISRLQHEALRLSDEAKAFLSIDPLDDDSLAFQGDEVTRRCARINAMLARGVDG